VEINELKEILKGEINKSNGLKMAELIVLMPREVITKSCVDDIYLAIEQLVKEKEIIEIEFTLPNMSYKIKSFLLPKDTELCISGCDYIV